MEASKHRPRKHRMGSSKRVPPYLLLVLLAVGAAAVSVGILHKMRERRVLAVLVQERDQQLISFQVLLEVFGYAWLACMHPCVCMNHNCVSNR
jgi:hypothetical protein